MYDELLNMLTRMASEDLSTKPTFRAIVMIRDHLVADKLFNKMLANETASSMSVEINQEVSDEELEALVTPFVELIINIAKSYMDAGFSLKDFKSIAKQFSLTLNG